MCLKLMAQIYELPEFDFFLNKANNYANEKSNQIEEMNFQYDEIKFEENERKRKLENYENCKEILKKIISDDIPVICYFEVLDKSEQIWNSIYNRHLTGENPGLRKWSRSKYFADLLNMFPHGIGKENENLIRQRIKREFKQIGSDYKSAIWVYSIIYANKEKEFIDNNIKNFSDKKILEEMIRLDKISALEPMHSWHKIKKYSCNDILRVTENEFKEKYFDFTYEENFLIYFKQRQIPPKKLLNFIYEQWKKKIITTRDIKPKDKNDFISDLSLLLVGLDIKNHLNEDQLNEIYEFDLSIEQLKDIIDANEFYYEDKKAVLQRFKDCKKIKEANKKFIELREKQFNLKKIEPKYVFVILLDQLNSIQEKFIQAKAATMRAIIEQLILWMYFDHLKGKDKLEHAEKMSLHNNISQLRTEVFQRLNSALINRWIKALNIKEEKKTIEDIHNLLLDKDKKIWNYLNFCVHASHKLYISREYAENLAFFNEKQKLLILLLQSIDVNKFNALNNLIISHLKDKK